MFNREGLIVLEHINDTVVDDKGTMKNFKHLTFTSCPPEMSGVKLTASAVTAPVRILIKNCCCVEESQVESLLITNYDAFMIFYPTAA